MTRSRNSWQTIIMCRHCQCRYPKYKIEICWRYRFRVSISMLLVNENIITKLKCNFSFCQYQIESRMSLAKRRENLQSQNTSSNKKLKVRNNNARKKTYWPPTNNKPFYLSCQQPLDSTTNEIKSFYQFITMHIFIVFLHCRKYEIWHSYEWLTNKIRMKKKCYHLFKQTATDICMSCFNSLLRYTEHYTQLQQSGNILIAELPISYTLLKLLPINFLKVKTTNYC